MFSLRRLLEGDGEHKDPCYAHLLSLWNTAFNRRNDISTASHRKANAYRNSRNGLEDLSDDEEFANE